MKSKDDILLEQAYEQVEQISVTEGIFDRFTSNVSSKFNKAAAIGKNIGKLARGQNVKGSDVVKAGLNPKLKAYFSDLAKDLNNGIGSDFKIQIGRTYPKVATALGQLMTELKNADLIN